MKAEITFKIETKDKKKVKSWIDQLIEQERIDRTTRSAPFILPPRLFMKNSK